jgi:acyl-CoA dehydrogenase
MDLTMSPAALERQADLRDFMATCVYPAEPVYARERVELTAQGRPNHVPPVLEELIEEARRRGLWNLFLPAESGLSQVDYAMLAEETGRSPFIAPAAMNCLSPDSGNMEMLAIHGTPDQRERWLDPLLDGRIRSAFSMTEPEVASSDATNISTRIRREGDEYVITGRKWFSTGAADSRTELLIVLGRSDPDAPRHRQHTMVLVPKDTPGVSLVRTLPVFGFRDQQGHAEIVYDDVRVPVRNRLGEEGGGFAVAQSRLGPGRIHHCMRAVGMAGRPSAPPSAARCPTRASSGPTSPSRGSRSTRPGC